jgi:hypothetical protein
VPKCLTDESGTVWVCCGVPQKQQDTNLCVGSSVRVSHASDELRDPSLAALVPGASSSSEKWAPVAGREIDRARCKEVK